MFPVNLGSPQLWASSILDLCWLTSGAMAGDLWKWVRSGVPPSYLHWVDWCELYNLCKTECFPLSLCYSGHWDLAFCGFIHWRCCEKFQTLKQRQQATLSFQLHDVLGSPVLSSWKVDRPLPSTMRVVLIILVIRLSLTSWQSNAMSQCRALHLTSLHQSGIGSPHTMVIRQI